MVLLNTQVFMETGKNKIKNKVTCLHGKQRKVYKYQQDKQVGLQIYIHQQVIQVY